ncbi:hypothetical protein IGI03_05845 [Bacillus thuringiensis]|uniref:hypothetical protein n=1 Tax=Bacillus thuringiensis TaxID=1428 RepID=UPI001873D952|nr:hypothetical protein [Bacillus thuringiensis]MBE5087570.1 hypothetical protein [Bacillus thuringiensis]
MSEINLQTKIENETKILNQIIEHYKQSDDPDAPCMIVAYKYGLQVLNEVYEVSEQEEVVPF